MSNACYEICDGKPIYADKNGGAIYCDDEQWHPFRYFDNGDLDIGDDRFIKASSAYKLSKLKYT